MPSHIWLHLPVIPQEFDVPPTLCVGGCLRVELLGKRQRQAADDAFYSEPCFSLLCVGQLRRRLLQHAVP